MRKGNRQPLGYGLSYVYKTMKKNSRTIGGDDVIIQISTGIKQNS